MPQQPFLCSQLPVKELPVAGSLRGNRWWQTRVSLCLGRSFRTSFLKQSSFKCVIHCWQLRSVWAWQRWCHFLLFPIDLNQDLTVSQARGPSRPDVISLRLLSVGSSFFFQRKLNDNPWHLGVDFIEFAQLFESVLDLWNFSHNFSKHFLMLHLFFPPSIFQWCEHQLFSFWKIYSFLLER